MKRTPYKKSRAELADAPTPRMLDRWVVVGRGSASTFAKPDKGARTLGEMRQALKARQPTTVKLAPDVAEVFRHEDEVNAALRKVIELRDIGSVPRRKKTA